MPSPRRSTRFDYESVAAKLLAAPNDRKRRIALMRHAPHVVGQLETDAAHPEVFSFWGRSENFDEKAGRLIVPPEILETLGGIAGVDLSGRIVHAGAEHAYGYLFSLIETPYGFKRERWTTSVLDRGLGFSMPTLRDRPWRGTLLMNLTLVLGHIAFDDRPDERETLSQLANEVGERRSIQAFRNRSLAKTRIREIAHVPRGRRAARDVELITDLVTVPHASTKLHSLLVYSIRDHGLDEARLVTAFGVNRDAANELKTSTSFGKRQPIRLRYNGYAEGLRGKTVTGARTLEVCAAD